MSDNDAAALICSLLFGGGFLLIAMRMWFKHRERRGQPEVTAATEAMEKRLARVEVALDDVTTELGRMTESHQFLVKALSEREPVRELRHG